MIPSFLPYHLTWLEGMRKFFKVVNLAALKIQCTNYPFFGGGDFLTVRILWISTDPIMSMAMSWIVPYNTRREFVALLLQREFKSLRDLMISGRLKDSNKDTIVSK